MAKRKPKVYKARKKTKATLDVNQDGVFNGEMSDVCEKIKQAFEKFNSNRKSNCKECCGEPKMHFSETYSGSECWISQEFYTESEEDWKERVRTEELALMKWEMEKAEKDESKALQRKKDLQEALKRIESELEGLS